MTMAYWDKGSKESRKHGLPASLTSKLVELDGEVRCEYNRGLLSLLVLDSLHASIKLSSSRPPISLRCMYSRCMCLPI